MGRGYHRGSTAPLPAPAFGTATNRTRSGLAEELAEGLVVRAQSGFYDVETARGTVRAVMRGVLKRERQWEGLATLGDHVLLGPIPTGGRGAGGVDAQIVEVLPRRTRLVRRWPGPKGTWAQDVVVANIDQLVPVVAASAPAPNFGLLDRFLALAEMDELDAVIVLNKCDLEMDPVDSARIATYERIGYPVQRVSAHSGAGIAALAEELKDKISAFVGPSGVGKSSLLNALEPGLALRVGEVSQALGKGKHTTRTGVLARLAGGGMVADTPGLRELGLWDVDPGELEWAFVEFRPFLNTCRFNNCSHRHEPGCSVRAAVEAGAIDRERFASYETMLEDELPDWPT